MATWEPQYQPLTQEMLESMVNNHWLTPDELMLWQQDQLPPKLELRVEGKIQLARLLLDPSVPVQ